MGKRVIWPWVVGGIAAAGAAAVALLWPSKAKEIEARVRGALGDSVQARVAAALATQDPETMRRVAGELEREGAAAAATDLRVAAEHREAELRYEREGETLIEKLTRIAQSPPDEAVEEIIQETEKVVRAAGVEPSPKNEPEEQRDALGPAAKALAEHLRGKEKGQEKKQLVVAYQKLAGLEPDGLYGLKTAISLGENGVSRPPDPLYWGGDTWAEYQRQKETWERWLDENA